MKFLIFLTLFTLYGIAVLPADQTPPPRGGEPSTPPKAGNFKGKRPPVERYLERLKKENPQEFERLHNLRETNPQAFRLELRKKAHRSGDEKRKRPNAHLPHALRDEIRNVKKAQTEEEREIAVRSLRLKVEKLVDHNLKEREAAIEKFKARLKRLEAQTEYERTHREKIVDHHMERLLNKINSSSPDAEKKE